MRNLPHLGRGVEGSERRSVSKKDVVGVLLRRIRSRAGFVAKARGSR